MCANDGMGFISTMNLSIKMQYKKQSWKTIWNLIHNGLLQVFPKCIKLTHQIYHKMYLYLIICVYIMDR